MIVSHLGIGLLILGVTGQDGSFMARFLLEKNFIVHGFVRKSSTGNTKNITDLIIKKNFYIHHGDLLDLISIEKIFQGRLGSPWRRLKLKGKYTKQYLSISRFPIEVISAK